MLISWIKNLNKLIIQLIINKGKLENQKIIFVFSLIGRIGIFSYMCFWKIIYNFLLKKKLYNLAL